MHPSHCFGDKFLLLWVSAWDLHESQSSFRAGAAALAPQCWHTALASQALECSQSSGCILHTGYAEQWCPKDATALHHHPPCIAVAIDAYICSQHRHSQGGGVLLLFRLAALQFCFKLSFFLALFCVVTWWWSHCVPCHQVQSHLAHSLEPNSKRTEWGAWRFARPGTGWDRTPRGGFCFILFLVCVWK